MVARVIGWSAWLPGARGEQALRERLRSGEPSFERLPELRWSWEVFEPEMPPGHARCERGATLGEPEVDWRSLKLPPLSVARMHAMEKVALEVMASALRDAGVEPRSPMGERVRVYLAATTLGPDPRTDHGRRIRRHELARPVAEALRAHAPERAEEVSDYVDSLFNLLAPPVEPDSMMSSASILAGRICNLWDLRGGHVAIDGSTASSLAAIEAAMEDLADGACDVALVAAVSPMLTPSGMLALAHRGLLGADSPRPFAADSQGALLGEGAVALVLDRGAVERGAVPDARTRGWIEAVAGATLPRRGRRRLRDAVAHACSAAFELAGVPAEEAAFVASRASGMASVERDEGAALADVFGSAAREGGLPLACHAAIFGHLGPASGLAATLDALMALEAGSLHAPPLSPSALGGAAREDLPPGLRVGATDLALPPDARAGVSDAGLAGRAYHAVVSAPGAHPSPSQPPPSTGPRIEAADRPEPLAITGLGLVAPGADDVDAFWQNVLQRVESIGDLPASRWDVDSFIGASEELGAILKTRLAAPVKLPDPDPARFRLSPAALGEVDPAVLLSMVSAEQAIEDAGGVEGWSRSRVAVTAGQLSLRWAEAELEKRALFAGHVALVAQAMRESDFDEAQVQAVVGAARAAFSGPRYGGHALGARTSLECAAHVARFWGLTGPVLSVDAACASSMAAIERSARKLARREVDAAVAIGVAFNLLPEYYIVLSILGALSPRGAPPFHLGADGFVPGEGAAAVVLERLSDAQARGARVHAVIRGIGVSSDGAGLSIFAPNSEGEQRAIRRALALGGWSPREVDLVEAHGTGTRLGDETEIHSYAATYGDRDPTTPLTVGTVKSQVGHLSSAAGMVGIVKTALAVREGVLPPTLGEDPSPELMAGPLRLPAHARGWVMPEGKMRRAGVSAFGLGGINYHVLLEEAPTPAADRSERARGLPQARLPARDPLADRFEVELTSVSLGARTPRAPVAGHTVWILPDDGGLWRAVGAALEQRHARVVVLGSEPDAASPADGIVDLSTFGVRGPEGLHQRASEATRRALRTLRPVYERFTRARPAGAFYVAVTSLGGDLGLGGAGEGDLAGAALLGLAKGLKQELPASLCRGVDFDPHEDPETVAEVVVRELEDGNDQLEVAWAGRRLVPRLRRLPLGEDAPRRAVEPDDVVVVSGGGRGVVFECATALARLGARVVVTGRTPLPVADAPFLQLDDEAFEAFGREHMLARRREDPSASPRRLRAEIAALEKQRELHENLQRAVADDLPLEYAECDVTDRGAVDALLADVRARLGPITGLAHGAMVQWSTLASRKEPAKVDATLAVKGAALANLLDATREDPLKIVLGFGSGAGRFGNRGQADYCAANALMAAMIASAGRVDRRGARFVTVDWTAWDSVGAAVEDPDLKELLRSTGITSISVEEGLYWFLREWTAGASSEVVVFEERMLHDWPFLGRQAEHDESGALEVDDLGRPLVEGAWPLVDQVLEREPGRVVIERRLEAERDAFIEQHRLHGVPILPATFGCELLAEVAALCVPGMEVEAAYDVRIQTPAKLFRERPLVLRARAVVEADGAQDALVRSESRSRLTLHGRHLEERVHHAARFRLRLRGSAVVEPRVIEELEGTAKARSFFHMARAPVTLGPLYSRGEWIQVRDRVIVGRIRAPRQRDVSDRTSFPLFQVDPLMMDTAFQIAANWDGLGQGCVSIPYGLERLRMGRPRRRGEGARVRAEVTRVDDPDVYYDIDVASDDGELLMEIRGLHLRRITEGE